MKSIHKIKISIASVLLIAYVIPLVIPRSALCDCPSDFVDYFYALATTLGIGGYLISENYKLKYHYENYLFSVGVFFVVLFLIFLFDMISDSVFKTLNYVIFNLIITIICFASLTFQRLFTPQ